jgi:putative ABC transport system substrate-binding protein
MRRKFFAVALCALLFALCVSAQAQQPKKVPRIGFVTATSDPQAPGPQLSGFRQGLRSLGYVEGKNILVEYRYAAGKSDLIPGFVAELVQLKVDVLVVGTTEAILAAKQATRTIPIVMVTTQDPVVAGIVDSLARPGGNITGLATLIRDLGGKRLELLKETVPRISRVGILRDIDQRASAVGFAEYEAAARLLKLELQSLEIHGSNPDLEGAFQAAVNAHARALITVRGPVLNRQPKQIADLAIRNRLPSMYEGSHYVDAGGLMSYSSSDAQNWSSAAIYVDKILKGAKPADLPIEQPTKFEFVINLKTAKQIGLTIPQSVLYRADRVIK